MKNLNQKLFISNQTNQSIDFRNLVSLNQLTAESNWKLPS